MRFAEALVVAALALRLGGVGGGAPAVAETVAETVGEVAAIPLSEIHAGMRGYGLSVFRGTVPERFDVEVLGVLENKPGAAREVVCLNAGAALYVANAADSIGDGIARAREAIASGAARAKVDAFVAFTQKHVKQPA